MSNRDNGCPAGSQGYGSYMQNYWPNSKSSTDASKYSYMKKKELLMDWDPTGPKLRIIQPSNEWAKQQLPEPDARHDKVRMVLSSRFGDSS